MNNQYEIEIKSLLGEKKNADILRDKLTSKNVSLKSQHKQLNHYFVVKDLNLFKSPWKRFNFLNSLVKNIQSF